MSAEMYEAAFKEIARQARINNHPHRIGCDGSGDIDSLKIDKVLIVGLQEPRVLGSITRCNSCGYVKKTGTLENEDTPSYGGGYYF